MFRRSALLTAIAVATSLPLTVACAAHSKPAGKAASADQLVQVGLLELKQNNQAKALTAFEQAAATSPENYYAHYNIGFIRQAQGKPAAALEQYQLALAAKSDFVPALYNSGTIYGASDPTHAIMIYRQVVKADATYAAAYLNLGLLEATTGQSKQALVDLQKALRLNPSFVSRIPAKLFPNLKPATSKASPAATSTP